MRSEWVVLQEQPKMLESQQNVRMMKHSLISESALESSLPSKCKEESSLSHPPRQPLSLPKHSSCHSSAAAGASPMVGTGKYFRPKLNWNKHGQWSILYGREQQVQQLQDMFLRRVSNSKNVRPELCLVAGKSGTGKSVLVQRALKALVQEDYEGMFLLGKFDQRQTPEPYGPIAVALTQLVLCLQQRDTTHSLGHAFLEQIGMEAFHVLCGLVPSLGPLVLKNTRTGDKDEKKNPTSFFSLSAQQDRLKGALAKLFQVVASKESPVVLVLDDLQWADMGSLHLLESLIANESKIEGLMVVGICRDNEVSYSHQFASVLRRLEDEKGASIVHIDVPNLPLEDANSLVAHVLQQTPAVCLPLTQVIHYKTQGNVLFMLYYLKALYEEGVLMAEHMIDNNTQSNGTAASYQLVWNDAHWQGGFHSLDIVDLVAFQIKRLPLKCQKILIMASCLGAEFDSSMLSLLLNGSTNVTMLSDGMDLALALQDAVDAQMAVKQMNRPGKFAFSHDRVQQASYALIPEEERTMMHVTIGRTLYEGLTPTELQENLFLVVNQLILGIPLLTSEVDKNGLAALALDAGTKASKAGDFATARMYFQTGVDLLGPRHWRDEYHLSLNLFNSLAEADLSCDEFEKLDSTIDEILMNCRSPRDEIQPNVTRILSLSERGQFAEALQVGFRVLSETLGESFPSKPRPVYLIMDIVKLQKKLKAKSDEELLSLPPMDNHYKMAAMHVLAHMAASAYCGGPDWFPFILCRLVNLSLKYGLSDASGFGLVSYAMIMTHVGDYDQACRFAELGHKMVLRDEYARSKWFSRVQFLVYAAIYPWKKPILESLDHLPAGIAAGLDSGDYESAAMTAYSNSMSRYIGGEQLSVVESRLDQYMIFIRQYRKGPWLSLSLLLQRFLLNVLGKTSDPKILERQEEGHACICPVKDDKMSFQLQDSTWAALQMVLAYHFGDIDLALKHRKIVKSFEETCKSTNFIIVHYFYDAMTLLEAAHLSKRRKRIASARRVLKKLEKMAAHQSYVQPMVYLLKAEMQILNKNLKKSMEWYGMAQAKAKEEGAMEYHALAFERAAMAQRRLCGCAEESQKLMNRAIELYEEWGAVAISNYLRLREQHVDYPK